MVAIVGLSVAEVGELHNLATESSLATFEFRTGIRDSNEILRIRRGDVAADEALQPLV